MEVEQARDIADVLSAIDAITGTLPVVDADPLKQAALSAAMDAQSHRDLILRAREVIRELETTTRALSAKKSELALSVTALARYAKVLDIIHPIEKELPALEGFEVTILLIQQEHSDVIGLIRQEIATITGDRFEMISTTVDAETLAAIMVFPKSYSEQVHAFIYSVNVNEVRLPKEYTGKPFYEMYALIAESRSGRRKRSGRSICISSPSLRSGTRNW